MMPDAITCLFKEAHDAFPPLEGKPSNDDLLVIWETLLLLLMVILYNQLNGVHSLMAILTEAVKYKANHGAKFVCPACLPLYDKLSKIAGCAACTQMCHSFNHVPFGWHSLNHPKAHRLLQ
jgi:hypothetical protein